MKKYIKPSILALQAEASIIMSGSMSSDGSNADLYNPGKAGASSARAKRHTIDSLWDDTWDSDDENNGK